VRAEREEALVWHRHWKSCGCPREGPVAERRRISRARYHYAVRSILRQEQILRDSALAQSMRGSDRRQFWKDVKRRKDRNKPTAVTIDDANTRLDICNLFADKYKTLYNSVLYDSSDMVDFLSTIEGDMRQSGFVPCRISKNDVKKVVSELKRGKTDGHMTQQSDHLINGTPQLFEKLAQLFTVMISHGFAPESFLLATLLPIVKNARKSTNCSSNYRGITLSSIMGKVLDRIILKHYQETLASSDLQFGFKRGHSTLQCTLVIDEVAKYFLKNDGDLYVMLLDASQAFDRVNFIKLFNVLREKGMCPLLCRFLVYSYTKQKIRVKWDDVLSDSFDVSNGVKQGGVLSPTLFNVYVDGMLQRMKQCGVGCHLGGTFAGAVSYADDLTLLAPSLPALQIMLDIAANYAESFDIKFNASKSQLVAWNKGGFISCSAVFIGETVRSTSNAVHLGNPIGVDVDNLRIKKACNEMISQCNSLCALFPKAPIHVKYSLFKSYCMPLYGAQLWRLNSSNIERIHVCWRKCLRRLLHLPSRTHSNLLHVICRDVSFPWQLFFRTIKFIISLYNSENILLRSCMNMALSGSCSSLGSNILTIRSQLGVPVIRSSEEARALLQTTKTMASNNQEEEAERVGGAVRDLLILRDEGVQGWTASDFNIFIETLCCD